jgi:hypothetical protein
MSPLQILFGLSAAAAITCLAYWRIIAFRAWAANDLHWVKGPRGWSAAQRRWRVTPSNAKLAFVVGICLAVLNLVAAIFLAAPLMLG